MSSEEKKDKVKLKKEEVMRLHAITTLVMQHSQFSESEVKLERLIEDVSRRYDAVYRQVEARHIQQTQINPAFVIRKKCAKCTKLKCTNCINRK